MFRARKSNVRTNSIKCNVRRSLGPRLAVHVYIGQSQIKMDKHAIDTETVYINRALTN
jgi:hypothetical protein